MRRYRQVFAREDVDGVRRSKRDKRKVDEAGAEEDRDGNKAGKKQRTGRDKSDRADRKAEKKEKKARKKALAALVLGARGGGAQTGAEELPSSTTVNEVKQAKSAGDKSSKRADRVAVASRTAWKESQGNRLKQLPPPSSKHPKHRPSSKARPEQAKKKKKENRDVGRTYWEHVKIDGEVFERGDCAYVISDRTVDFGYDEEEELCEACNAATSPHGHGDGADIMLECDSCLRGWHLDCLNPPLADVPEVGPRNQHASL